MRRTALLSLVALAVASPVLGAPATRCLRASGKAGVTCLAEYTAALGECRAMRDDACQEAAHEEGGAIEQITTRTDGPARARCTEVTADALGYLGIEDLAARIPEACTDFAEDFLHLAYAATWATLSDAALACQSRVVENVQKLHARVVEAFGPGCYVQESTGARCARKARDRAVKRARAAARRKIVGGCGAEFDGLGLAEGATTDARVDALLDVVIDRARHFAQRVYPPNDLGPTAEFGPFPIGVRTLDLVDPARLDASGTGPRPVKVEVYYPSTAEAVTGVPEDVVQVLGIDIVATPAFRDVVRAPGTFPLVLFSHGNQGIRFQSFFFTAHLASHGFVVVTPDHHGNTFVDSLLGILDPDAAANRPRDMSFLIDRFLAMNGEAGNFLAGAIHPERIGLSGHSFGGYTTFAVAGGPTALGTFTDPRVKAILPQAPAAPFPDDFYPTITVPTLILGGSIDETTPFASQQLHPFEELPAGASVVALAEVIGAGHFTFSDFCEVPRNLLSFLGGFDEACEPRHLPWRHAHDLVNYLSLNFFDGVLNGNADALARLDARRIGRIEDLAYQRK